MKNLFSATLLCTVISLAFGQGANNVTFDNLKGIKFEAVDGTDDTQLYKDAGNKTIFQYAKNHFRFLAFDNRSVQIANSAGEVKIQLHPNGNSVFSEGSFGIGPTTSELDTDYKLHISKGDQAAIKLENKNAGSGSIAFANSTGMQSRFQFNNTGGFNFQKYDGTDFNTTLKFTTQGNLGIGTTDPTERLEVNGKIRSKEVRVEITGWPDYVFEKNYRLSSLQEIESYIDENKHLPEVPSAKEIEANGVQLGEMNKLLLKKIEELTLHTIQQQKLIEAQGKLIEQQGIAIKELKEQFFDH